MAVNEQRIREFQEAAKELGERDFLGSAFGIGRLGALTGQESAHEDRTTEADQAHTRDPGKEHRDELKLKAHNYAVKSGSDESSIAGLRMNQVNASGTSAAGGKSKKERQTQKAIIDEMLRQLADINRQIQWYEKEIHALRADLSHVQIEVKEANARLSEIDDLIALRDGDEFDPENNPEHAARLKALGISIEEYLADPGILDRAAQEERDRIRDLKAQEQDLKTRISDYGDDLDQLKEEREGLTKKIDRLGNDPSVQELEAVTASVSDRTSKQVTADASTSIELSQKLLEARGRGETEQDELMSLKEGASLQEVEAPIAVSDASPDFLHSDPGSSRTTSTAKEITQPPFMTASISDKFEKAHRGESSDPEEVQKQTVVADLHTPPDFNTV